MQPLRTKRIYEEPTDVSKAAQTERSFDSPDCDAITSLFSQMHVHENNPYLNQALELHLKDKRIPLSIIQMTASLAEKNLEFNSVTELSLEDLSPDSFITPLYRLPLLHKLSVQILLMRGDEKNRQITAQLARQFEMITTNVALTSLSYSLTYHEDEEDPRKKIIPLRLAFAAFPNLNSIKLVFANKPSLSFLSLNTLPLINLDITFYAGLVSEERIVYKKFEDTVPFNTKPTLWLKGINQADVCLLSSLDLFLNLSELTLENLTFQANSTLTFRVMGNIRKIENLSILTLICCKTDEAFRTHILPTVMRDNLVVINPVNLHTHMD